MAEHRTGSPREDADDPIADVERRVMAGELSREAVERARVLWRTRFQNGIVMPNGERILISDRDLHHLLVVDRILRKPERIERLLRHVFEIRTARSGRRMGLSQWSGDGETVYGYAILDANGHVRTMHVVDARGLRKKARQGEHLWRRDK